MSNQVTNLEIEDVLSSIRRLVAEGDKLRSTPPKPDADTREARVDPLPLRGVDRVVAPPQDRDTPAEAERAKDVPRQAPKFVLTPALRVAEPRPSTVLLWEEAGDDPAPEARIGADTAERSDHGTRAPKTDSEPLVLSSPEPLADDPVTDVASDAVTQTGHDRHMDLDRDPSASVSDDAAAIAVESRSRLAATIAELEAAITAKHDEWEPDGSEVTPVMDWASETAEPAFLSARQGSNRAVVEDAQEVPDWTGAAASNVDLRADTWAGRHDDADDWPDDHAEDADGRLGDDLAKSTLPPSDGPSHADRTDSTVATALSEEQILDEEALRALVVEIVRQELQGALGERITRNVRKLVRREIYRILSSQDFD